MSQSYPTFEPQPNGDLAPSYEQQQPQAASWQAPSQNPMAYPQGYQQPMVQQPYGQQPTYPQQPYGVAPQQYPGQQPGYPMQQFAQPAPAQPQRSKGARVAGIVLLVWAGLAILGQIGQMANPGPRSVTRASLDRDPYRTVGYLIGWLIFIVVPLILGIILVRRSKK